MSMSASAMVALIAALPAYRQAQAPPITPQPYNQTNITASFGTAPTIAEPSRLQITPAMDGKIENEEWDVLGNAGGTKTFFQWEPGVIYVAGIAPVGSDLLLSLDLNNDGWLVGADNYEARLRTDANGSPSVSIRRLNAVNVAGPTWEDLPGWVLSSVCKATVNGSNVEYELKLSDAGLGVLPRKPQKIGARVDLIGSSEPISSPTQPRVLSQLSLAISRAEGLPSNIHYEVDRADKPAIAGESASIRFDFLSKLTPASPPVAPSSQPAVKRININAEGGLKAKMSDMNSPFPAFDRAGRASVDYVSKLAADAEPGYHVLKCTLLLGDDTPATVESCFRIAEPISVEIVKPFVPVSPQDRTVNVGFNIVSNINEPVKGSLSFAMDPTFRVVNRITNGSRFTLEPRGRTSDRFQIYVPANSSGTYPITFDITNGQVKRHFVEYLTFGASPSKKRSRS